MGLGDRGLSEGGGHGAVVVSEKMFVYSRCADERVARRKIGGARNTACRRMDQLSNIGAGCNRRRRRTGKLLGEVRARATMAQQCGSSGGGDSRNSRSGEDDTMRRVEMWWRRG
jgi:hypothetical protein